MISPEYSAGFFDGEGTVYAATRNSPSRKRPSATILVCISNTNLASLEAHKEKWGGSIYGKKRREGHQPIYQWVLCTKKSYDFLKSILPFLIIKKEVVQKAIEYMELIKNTPRKDRVDYSHVVQSGNRMRVSPIVRQEFYDKTMAIHSDIRRLNMRGAPFNKTRMWHA